MKRTQFITLTILVLLLPLAAWAGYQYNETKLSEGRLELTVTVLDASVRVNESVNSTVVLKNIDNHGIRAFNSVFWAVRARYCHENGTEVRWLYHTWPPVKPPMIRERNFPILEPGQSLRYEIYSLPMEFPGRYFVRVEYHVGDYEGVTISHWKGSVFSKSTSFVVGD